MATEPDHELVQDEASDSDEETFDDNVKVKIAIFGNVGSGKSSFVNAILGLEEDEKYVGQSKKIAKMTSTSDDKESTSYSHPDNPNIVFSIFTLKDDDKDGLRRSLESIETEIFDVYLIFTASIFTKKEVLVARKVGLAKRKYFFVRTKFDNQIHPEEFNKEKLVTKLRESLHRPRLEDFSKCEIHLISNLEPYKWDFLKLTKAIADAVPPVKAARFRKMPQVKELVALEKFHSFLKEVEKEQRKTLPKLAEIRKFFLGSGILGVQRAMNEKLNRWKEVKINLAILGNSGVGKSSFINAIRGVDDDDDDEYAATTGVVETTREPTPFEHPTNPNIRFWDLPGIGTPNYPNLKIFCEKVAIEKYDTFLIICSKRFTNNDLLLGEKVQSMGKSFFFIRAKIDNDIRAEKRKKNFSEEKTLKELKEDCIENLRNFNHGTEKIFLISSFFPAKWDFGRLKKAILDQLPSKQKESFALSMRSQSEYMVKEKIGGLRNRVWMVAAGSVVTKFASGSLLFLNDGKLIKNKVSFYCKQLEFPDPDSEEFNMLSDDLQRRVERFYPGPDADICEWLKSFDSENTFKIRKRRKLIMTNKPLKFVYRFLNFILDKMEEAALAILCEAAVRGDGDDSDSD